MTLDFHVQTKYSEWDCREFWELLLSLREAEDAHVTTII